MSVYYLDSSAWVKRYLQEPGSEQIEALFERSERMASCSLGYVEVASALARRQAQRGVTPESLDLLQQRLTSDWSSFARVQITRELIDSAAELARTLMLRGADAVHLAAVVLLKTALSSIREDVVLIASDEELLLAAKRINIAAEDPSGKAK